MNTVKVMAYNWWTTIVGIAGAIVQYLAASGWSVKAPSTQQEWHAMWLGIVIAALGFVAKSATTGSMPSGAAKVLVLGLLLAGCATGAAPPVTLIPAPPPTVSGTTGAAAAGAMTLTDASAAFTPALINSVLHVAGVGTGCVSTYYFVVDVPTATSLTLAASPCSVATTGITYTVGQPSPVQALIALIGALAVNPIFQLALVDANDTLAWVAGPQGPTTPLLQFQAKACPTAVELAIGDFQAKAAGFQQVLAQLDQGTTGAPSPELILFFTKLRYGPQAASPQVQLASIRQDLFNQVSAVVDSCRQIFPAKQVAQLVRLAAAAGIIVGSGGTALPALLGGG